jgi:SAM-dependent methyltransferase
MADVRASIDLALTPDVAFDLLVEELGNALARLGIRFEPGPGGRVAEGAFEVGRVVEWEPGRGLGLEWRHASWAPGVVTEMRLRLEPAEGGARVSLEHRGWDAAIADPVEMGGWFAGQVLAPLLSASSPGAFGDWFTDRRARCPSGAAARATYLHPLYHLPNFRVILGELALTRDDHLLEVGCGGGAFLAAALHSGCRAAAIDHSQEMVRLAREANGDAVASGRLDVREGDAQALPFSDATFTCAAMTGVLGFLADPVRSLAEIRRVLVPGGRFVGLGSDPELKGTPAAPEPMASRLRFYDSAQLEALARQAGFADARVIRRDLEPFAREAGVPEAHLPLFAAGEAGGARFLLARRA